MWLSSRLHAGERRRYIYTHRVRYLISSKTFPRQRGHKRDKKSNKREREGFRLWESVKGMPPRREIAGVLSPEFEEVF